LGLQGRYSEDIDLVQMEEGPIGPVLDAIRQALDPWLGTPKRNQSQGRVTTLYRFETTTRPVQRMRLKVEINTREHFTVSGIQRRRFSVENPWFSGAADICTHEVEELLGTKLRALYQRKKGRDLYDLWLAMTTLEPDEQKIVHCFEQYLEHGGTPVSRAEFEMNLMGKMKDPAFIRDVEPLLPTGMNYDIAQAGEMIHRRLINRLRGDPWKGLDSSEPFRR
jgi:predicted nucleotidyltransferase component of viral defense system